MRYYIFSSKPCQVLLGDNYLGEANGNLSYFKCDLESPFVRLVPKSPRFSEIVFCLNNKEKHPNVQLIDLYGDFLIVPSFSPRPSSGFEIPFDRSLENGVRVSLVCFITTKIIVANHQGEAQIPINLEGHNLTLQHFIASEKLILLLKEGNKNHLFIFDVNDTPKLIFYESGEKVICENNKIQLFKGVNLICASQIAYDINFSPFKISSTVKAHDFNKELKKELVPFAFLQAVQYNFDIAPFLHPTILENKNFISDFLGKFSAIIPLPQEVSNEKQYAILVGNRAMIIEISLLDNLVYNLSIL